MERHVPTCPACACAYGRRICMEEACTSAEPVYNTCVVAVVAAAVRGGVVEEWGGLSPSFHLRRREVEWGERRGEGGRGWEGECEGGRERDHWQASIRRRKVGRECEESVRERDREEEEERGG